MSVRCGRCSGYHESVLDVRACYNGETVATEQPTLSARDCLTPKQVDMVHKLLRKLGLSWNGSQPIEQLAKWKEGRVLIDQLKAAEKCQTFGKAWQPPSDTRVSAKPSVANGERPGGRQQPYPDVPAGHYAIKSLTGNNDLDFFRVDRPTEGTWAGRTFVKRVIGGRPSTPVRGRTAREALQAILDMDIEVSRTLYGRQIGQCWKCNRTLTDEISRQLGIGPVCRENKAA